MLLRLLEDVDLTHVLVNQLEDEALCRLVLSAKVVYKSLRVASNLRHCMILRRILDCIRQLEGIYTNMDIEDMERIGNFWEDLMNRYNSDKSKCERLFSSRESMERLLQLV